MSQYTREEKLQYLWEAMENCSNFELDYAAIRGSEYCREMDRLSMLRFQFEEDPMGEACLAYYHERGVRKEMHDAEDFYTRWILLLPERIPEGAKLPVLFWNHGGGNPIETDEFCIHYPDIAEEQYMLVMLQNTNWENLDRVLDYVLSHYPADSERVYAMGYSQGGQTVHAALHNIPYRLAAAAPGGIETYGLVDNMNRRYTLEQVKTLHEALVPVMQFYGSHEHLNILPLNTWKPVGARPSERPVHGLNRYVAPGQIKELDPSNPPNDGRPDRPLPVDDVDRIERMNLRLWTTGCKGLDVERCLALKSAPEGDDHRWMGFYGEEEELRYYYGKKHVIYRYFNKDGWNTYCFVAVENIFHWPLLMMGDLAWEFVRQYRRDSRTGKIMLDPYVRR